MENYKSYTNTVYIGDGSPGASEVSKDSAQDKLSQLYKEIDMLEATVDVLTSRLVWILEDVPVDNSICAKSAEFNAPILQGLSVAKERVEVQNSRIMNLIDRLVI